MKQIIPLVMVCFLALLVLQINFNHRPEPIRTPILVKCSLDIPTTEDIPPLMIGENHD